MTIKFRCIISMMINLKKRLTNEVRFNLLLYISLMGLLASLILTVSAWSTTRTFPLSPIFSQFTLSPLLHNVLFVVTIIGLVISLIITQYRRLTLGISLISLTVLIFTDITRLQPWVLHYSAVLALFSFLIPKRYFSIPYVLDAARLIVGGIYFWAGVQKLNARFFSEIFPAVTETLSAPFGETGLKIAILTGLFVPFVEALFALGFFTKKFRHLAILGSTTMIIIVLASLGPWGKNWNSSVWPWNFGIYGMVLVLFWGTGFLFQNFVLGKRKICSVG